MRVRTIAVLAAVALGTASTAAFAIQGSTWTGRALAKLMIKVKGRKPVRFEGSFPTDIAVGTTWTNQVVPVFDMETGKAQYNTVTASAFQFERRFPIGPASNTVVRNDPDNLDGLSWAHIAVESLVPPAAQSPALAASGVAFVFDFPEPTPPEGFTGLLIDGSGGSLQSSFRAIRNFTEIRGADTIRFDGLMVGGPDDGRPVTGVIKFITAGERVY